MLPTNRIALAAGILGATAGFASGSAGHFDVYIAFDGGVITTGGIDVDDLTINPGQRVFEADLGEFPAPPGFGDEPGLFADSLPAGVSVGFDIVDGLRKWNGSDFGDLATETMILSKGLTTVAAPSTDLGFAAGFAVATADGSGGFDDHPEYELAPGASAGIYLLSLTLWTDAPGIDDSAPIWFVFNNGLDEEDHEAAAEWVEANLVPGPTGLALLCVSLPIGARRRRR
jgi:hypothetical protein